MSPRDETIAKAIALELTTGHHGFRRWADRSKAYDGWRTADRYHKCDNDLWLCACCGAAFCPDHGRVGDWAQKVWLNDSEPLT